MHLGCSSEHGRRELAVKAWGMAQCRAFQSGVGDLHGDDSNNACSRQAAIYHHRQGQKQCVQDMPQSCKWDASSVLQLQNLLVCSYCSTLPLVSNTFLGYATGNSIHILKRPTRRSNFNYQFRPVLGHFRRPLLTLCMPSSIQWNKAGDLVPCSMASGER